MDNPQVTELEVAWLAGIWDGEGTISVRRNVKINQFSPRVSMVNTNAKIIQQVDSILDKMGIGHYLREKGQGGFAGSKRQCWIISIETLQGCRMFLEQVGKYLVGKYPQACILERFICSRMSRLKLVKRNSDAPYSDREMIWCKELYESNGNQRGTSETIREGAKVSA